MWVGEAASAPPPLSSLPWRRRRAPSSWSNGAQSGPASYQNQRRLSWLSRGYTTYSSCASAQCFSSTNHLNFVNLRVSPEAKSAKGSSSGCFRFSFFHLGPEEIYTLTSYATSIPAHKQSMSLNTMNSHENNRKHTSLNVSPTQFRHGQCEQPGAAVTARR